MPRAMRKGVRFGRHCRPWRWQVTRRRAPLGSIQQDVVIMLATEQYLTSTGAGLRHVLITGGAGFIGVNFVHYWLRHHADDRVVVLDELTYAGNRANLAAAQGLARYRFVAGDICEAQLVGDLMRDENIDCVVQFAAESYFDRSISGPDEFIRANVLGTHELLKSARASWSRAARMRTDVRFHHVSTGEVYGSLTSSSPVFTDATAYSPNSPYSASKAGSDHLVRAYHHTCGLPVTTSNCSNNYGPFQFPEKLIPLMHGTCARRQAVAGLRPRPERSGLALCRGSLCGDRHDPAAGTRGRDVQRRRLQRVAKYRHRHPVMRTAGGKVQRGRVAARAFSKLSSGVRAPRQRTDRVRDGSQGA